LIWPKDGCASIAYAAMAAANHFPPRAGALCIAKQNGRHPPSSAALRLARASAASIASGLSIAVEAAMGAAR